MLVILNQLKRMDIIIASSRGNNMKKRLRELHPNPQQLKIFSTPSLKIENIKAKLRSKFLKNLTTEQLASCHVYIIAGICDVTYRDVDKDYAKNTKYEEVIFNESPEEAFHRVTPFIQALANEIADMGATPCFATVVPCSLHDWNHLRLDQGKTAFLQHHEQYSSMQANMIRAIQRINHMITGVNNAFFMFTPLLAGTIMTNISGNRPTRVHYSRLDDGVHPRPWLRNQWVEKIIQAMAINQDRHRHQVHDQSLEDMREELNRSLENILANIHQEH